MPEPVLSGREMREPEGLSDYEQSTVPKIVDMDAQ